MVAGSRDKRQHTNTHIKHVLYPNHRIIWAMHYGVWPTKFLDHINGDPTDNRIENLREVTNQENCKNARIGKNNTSGRVGVSYYGHNGWSKWHAYIRGNGKLISLGYFEDFDAAVAAREAAEIEHGYHPNHGRR